MLSLGEGSRASLEECSLKPQYTEFVIELQNW